MAVSPLTYGYRLPAATLATVGRGHGLLGLDGQRQLSHQFPVSRVGSDRVAGRIDRDVENLDVPRASAALPGVRNGQTPSRTP